ncbi:MAG: SRPBCC domain-containing protein [Alphaproteobacteria bacterium]|nr:SRPBCC domain-containing protein [Alphaproteobacteria bacterium]
MRRPRRPGPSAAVAPRRPWPLPWLAGWLLLAAVLMARPAQARLASQSADGFVSSSTALLPLPPAAVWAALTNWSAWWDPAHSYGGTPGTITLEASAGGRLVERWPGGSTIHASVLTVMPPALLRLSGGFGPLQSLPVNAVLDISLKPEAGGTRLQLVYRVGGTAADGLDTLAAPVDAVMSAGFARLVRFATTGKP